MEKPVTTTHAEPEGRLSRRTFLAAAGAMAAPLILPARALGLGGATAPSNRINIAIIGNGSRGGNHLSTLLQSAQAQVVAVCDVQKKRAEAAQEQANKQYASLTAAGQYKGCAAYQDFREVLARPDLDAVVIAAPENWHALISIAAMKAGKDLYCEKALSLTVAEGQAVCRRVAETGRIFQAGTQQRSDRNFRFACELARNGYLGNVRQAYVGVPGGNALPLLPRVEVPADIDYDLWLGPAPWIPYRDGICSYNWYFNTDYCAGWIQSWGVHHMDIALWGLPALHASTLEVEGTAVFPTEGDGDVSYDWKTTLLTPGGITLEFASDKMATYNHGVRFVGDKGWVHVVRGGIQAEPQSLLSVVLKPEEEHLFVSTDHMANFLGAVRGRSTVAAPVDACHRATVATLAADAATRLGRKVVWDWKSERFVNDDAANRMLSRAMRAPWRVA